MKKYYMDYGILTEMREKTYNVVMLELLGSELAAKAKNWIFMWKKKMNSWNI